MNAEQINELYRLLNALREDVITDAEFERLDSWISGNERACRLYVDYIKIWAELQGFQAATIPDYSLEPENTLLSEENSFADSQFWGILAEHEKAADAIELTKEEPQRELIQHVVYRSGEKPKLSKSLIFTLISGVTGLFLLILYVNFFPLHREIATLTESVHAQWIDTDWPMAIGSRFKEEEIRFLKQGIVRIAFDGGAEAVLEAPAVIKLQGSDRMSLYSGRLYAVVPGPAAGFIVDTPSARIVDLGTEFGVDVDAADIVRTEVYKGRVAMRLGSDKAISKDYVIEVGQAGLVDQSGQLSVTGFSLQRRRFIRSTEEFQSGASLLNRNLIVNGDFETDTVVYDPHSSESQNLSENNVMISGWNDKGPATLNRYIALGGVPVPPDKGENFFIGFQASTIDQEISVTDVSYKINRGNVLYELSGWIGGWDTHEDHLEITASFLDNSDKLIGSAQIGPVTAQERAFQTCFVERSIKGILPPGVRKIVIHLRSIHGSGDTTDAYADNLKFVLSSND